MILAEAAITPGAVRMGSRRFQAAAVDVGRGPDKCRGLPVAESAANDRVSGRVE